MRFDKRLEGAEEISHADVCGMVFKAKGTAETEAQGFRCGLNREGEGLKRKKTGKADYVQTLRPMYERWLLLLVTWGASPGF